MFQDRIVGGIVGGVAGGAVFGVLMHMMGLMPTIASLVGSESAVVGWIVHAAISIGTGIVFALILGPLAYTYNRGLAWGAVYGVAWWIIGPLMLMPLLLGMDVQFANAFSVMNLSSLMGHALFGIILGWVYAWSVYGRGHQRMTEWQHAFR